MWEFRNLKLPAGMHIESGWADAERRKKNEAQLKHEEKVFGEKESNDDVNAYIKGQMGFGS
tara:strand:- start:4261 stop:4443 length:183 start_codon:yes stop_codon:yes gene_type:complete